MLWERNFREFLHYGAEPDGSYMPAAALRDLHALFKKLEKGRKPSSGDAAMFLRIRNRALFMLQRHYRQKTERTLELAFALGVRKNHDYGINNIPEYGLIGLVVRLDDKLMRTMHLMKVRAEVKDEKIKDTLTDTVNYATFAIMLCNGKWNN